MNETNVTNDIITSCLQNELDKPEYKVRLRAVDEDDLKKILNRLVNHIVHDEEETNANALISADDPEIAVTYGTILANALEKIISFDVYASITEAELYEWKDICRKRPKAQKAKVLLVTNLDASDPDILFKTLTDFEKQKYTPAVILCTTNDVVEKLKDYDVQDQKLYHYLCGLRKITIPGIAQADIADTICDRLEGEGKEVTEAFREKLKVHVEAIYSDAVLQKEAFLENLIVRIKSVHSEKGVDLWNLYDEEDVPPSDKADALWEKMHGAREAVVEEEENAYDTIMHDRIGIGGTIHQVMLLAMSTFRYDKDRGGYFLEKSIFKKPDSKDKDYEECSEDEIISNCFGQMEPVAKWMLEKIKDFFVVDFVIVSTEDTRKEQIIHEEGVEFNYSPIEYFVNRIAIDYLNNEVGYKFELSEEIVNDNYSRKIFFDEKRDKIVRFNIVAVNEKKPFEGLEKTISTIREIYCDKDKEEIRLWFDSHGGLRDIDAMLASLLSLLKNNEDIEPEKIYGVKYSANDNYIFEQKDMFEMYDFVTGMNDFFNYGNAKILDNSFNPNKNNDLISAMDKVAEGIQICSHKDYKAGLKLLKEEISKPNKDEKVRIFAESIKNDFGALISEDASVFMIVKRCFEKDLLQQALTFLESNMIDDYLEKQIIIFEKTKMDKFFEDHSNEIKNNVRGLQYGGFKKDYKADRDKEKEQISFDMIIWFTNYTSDCDDKKDTWKSYIKKPNDEKFSDTFLDFIDEKKEMNFIKTVVSENKHNLLGKLIRLHMALKSCRNTFNHANDQRPGLKVIKQAFKNYIDTYEEILESIQKS